jgi:DNA polymerase elongation subunit (family B)
MTTPNNESAIGQSAINKSEIGRKIIKIKRTILGKSFKLIDFHIYDQKPETETPDSDSDSGEQTKKSSGDESKFMIQMFGLGEKGDTCSIYIQDYSPFFYVKGADNWTQSNADILLRELQSKLGNYWKCSLLSAELVEHHKLYGFSGGKKHKFVKLTFKSQATMNKVKGYWYEYKKRFPNSVAPERILTPFVSQSVELELYESSIPPLLRYFHIHNVSPSGWVFIPTQKVGIPLTPCTTCTYEYICNLSDLKPLPLKETRVPYKICSFDIEASSSHGDFPIPIKTYKRLATNLVDVYLRQLNVGCVNDLTKSQMLLEKIILSAFSFAKCDDVDLVYPKRNPSKQTVKSLIQTLLEYPIDIKKLENTETNLKLMTISSIFEQMKEDAETQRENSGLCNSGHDDGDQDDDVELDEESVIKYTKKPTSKPASKASIKKSDTIIDLLASDVYSRDEQIQRITLLLNVIFKDYELEGDKVTFIGSTFMRYGEPEPYLNHCVVLNSCDPVENVVIETVTTETDLLLKWTEVIQRENPDIIIGYNIFGFDYEFMFRRAQENYCERLFLQLSRKIDEVCATQKKDSSELSIENTKIVLATGEYDLRYFKMTGRLQIDMYTYFRRDFNLPSYKLDDVAGQYISDDVKRIEHTFDLSGKPITELYSHNITGLHINDFIHIEISGFTSDYYKDGQKFIVCDIIKDRQLMEIVKGKEQIVNYNIICIRGHEHVDMTKSIKWNVAKDDVSPQDIFRLTNGSSADRAIVAKYCIQDCNLVHHLMNKIDVLTGYVEMAKICSVPISFLVFRGQGIKLTSYVAKKCREKNTLMPDLEKNYQDHDGYEGAIVLPPKCSMYMDNPVACVDYASLYPSSMISQNYSHDSKVSTVEYNLSGKVIKETGEKVDGKYIYDNLPEYQYVDIEFDTFKYLRNPERPAAKAVKTKVGKKVCRWAQLPNGQKSIMPAILEELLRARAETRKMIKIEKDPFMQNILDKRQLGYKVTANSLYGQCGAKTSTFYEKDVAASTTATGRMMITYAKRIIEEVYGDLEYDTKCIGPVQTKAEYVYGDTDSVFFTFNLQDPVTGAPIRGTKALEATIEIAQDAANLCTQWLKPPMELTYEKTLMPFILLSKKRYVGMLYETDPKKGKMKYMGLSLKRRDSCDYLKDTYGGILNILMKENNIQKAMTFLEQSLGELTAGNVPMDKLTITKALRGYYKNPAQIAHAVLADRIAKRDPGNKPKPGDRMKFVHIVSADKKALQGEKIETTDFILQERLALDYTFYITNQLMKPLQQLFGLALEQIWTFQNKAAAIKTYKKEVGEMEKEWGRDLEVFMKKKEKYCSAKVKVLLFDKVLTKITNDKNRIQPITSFFVAKQ